ncbi:hypothetical protein ES319_D04G040200v1 [Gossypium barbadense]|uniref:Endoplasmic reticulum vesicle transporter C-terminal domain-containing protein n=1 Tax=Gossypium barbadense TaxID=3634 RepID=A0A5J5RRM7_GOSBA|nr:hypothetical protein ES319_D04G040200v1 [Gossypium barbadense]
MRKRYIAVGVYCQRKSRYSYSKKSSYLPDLRKLIKRRKMGLKQTIRSLDAFPRTEEHLLQKTQSGALVASIDAIDLSGKHEVDLDTNIWKLRLNSHGHIIGTKYLSDLVEKQHTTRNHDDKEHHDGSAKKPHKFSFDKDAENMINKVKKALENGEGCRIFGGAKHVNVSHMIHDLSFGPKYPGLHNPLDDTVRILHDTSGTFKYYIKIVPTEYRYISKEVLPTNQFSVSEYFSPMNEFDRTWPAVYFLYDLSPITVTIKEECRSFLHFITRLSAVLGGTFALTGMLDRWMYRLIKALTTPSARGAYR